MIVAAAALSASLVALMSADAQIADCARASDVSPATFVRQGFDFKDVRLPGGTPATVAVSTSGCLAHNAVARVMIYARTPHGYRLVLDDYSLPEAVDVGPDGTVTLASHETVEIVDQAAYAWNGTGFVFAPYRSTRYDVALGESRPYERPLAFAPGASSATRSGSVFGLFGDTYTFTARAGQRVTVKLLHGDAGAIDVTIDDAGTEQLERVDERTWSGVLHRSGRFTLDVYGKTAPEGAVKVPYTVSIAIR